MTHLSIGTRAPSRGGRAAWVALPLAVLVMGCGDITSLRQSNPGQLDAGNVYSPRNAQLLVNGILSDFECAYSRVVTGGGLLADELEAAIASSVVYDYDRRSLLPTHPYSGACAGAQSPGVYTSLARARASADTTYARIAGWSPAEVPNQERLLGVAAAYGGWGLSLMGENMCTSAIDAGPELSSAQVFQEALSRFNLAITHATSAGDQTTLGLARLGRARIRLNLGDLAGAREDAATIPAGFLVGTTPAAADIRLQNIVHIHTHRDFFSTVGTPYRAMTLDGAPDPRVQVRNTGSVASSGAPVWVPEKYPTVTTSIPLATHAEAQLIIAEVLLSEGNLPGAAQAINAARNSRRAGMPQYSAAGQTAEQVRAQLVEERRRELFLEGRRLWDIRRLNLPLEPPAGTPYLRGGGTYGDQRCFPLPDVERNNNPNIS
jgi:starch-binding outer membrane protein, SusD/RagB family